MSQLKRKRQGQVDQSCSWICEAFQRLLEDTSFEDISVAQIVEKAGVSRQTFYRHFSSKIDLIEWRMEQSFALYIQELRELKQYDFYKDLVLVFKMMKREAPFMKLLFSAGLEYLILQKLTKYSYDLESVYDHGSERSLTYVADYFAGGIFMIIMRWIKDDMPESEEELATLVMERCFVNNYDSMVRGDLPA